MGLSIGYLLPTRDAIAAGTRDTRRLIELARRAEDLGFDAVWVGDSPIARPRHEPMTLLGAVAAQTRRARLGTAVLLAPLRHPLMLANEAATLDGISDGRLILGLGSGFSMPQTAAQFAAFGVNYETRVSRLEETISILRLVWSNPGEPISFKGRHFTFDDVQIEPAPVQPGGPAIWLAAGGAQGYERVGRIAQGWLPYSPSPQMYAEGRAVIEARACAERRPRPALGLYATLALEEPRRRDGQATLRRSIERYYNFPLEVVAQVQAMFSGDAEACAEWLAPYLDAGVEHLVLRLAGDNPEQRLELAAAELIPRLQRLSRLEAA